MYKKIIFSISMFGLCLQMQGKLEVTSNRSLYKRNSKGQLPPQIAPKHPKSTVTSVDKNQGVKPMVPARPTSYTKSVPERPARPVSYTKPVVKQAPVRPASRPDSHSNMPNPEVVQPEVPARPTFYGPKEKPAGWVPDRPSKPVAIPLLSGGSDVLKNRDAVANRIKEVEKSLASVTSRANRAKIKNVFSLQPKKISNYAQQGLQNELTFLKGHIKIL